MVRFVRVQQSRLYRSDAPAGDPGWWGFLVGPERDLPDRPIPLSEALHDQALFGSFVYSAIPPDPAVLDAPAAFIAALDALIENGAFGGRAMLWLPAAIPALMTTDRCP